MNSRGKSNFIIYYLTITSTKFLEHAIASMPVDMPRRINVGPPLSETLGNVRWVVIDKNNYCSVSKLQQFALTK